MNKPNRNRFRFSLIYLVAALAGMLLLQQFVIGPLLSRQTDVAYNVFREDLDKGAIDQVTIEADRILYTRRADAFAEEEGPPRVYTVIPVEDPDLVPALLEADVEFSGELPTTSPLLSILGWVIPFLPMVFIFWLLYRRMGQAGAGVMSIGKSKAKQIAGEMTGVKFVDVGGVDEVEVELEEIIEFLKDPARFTRLGAKLPKGVLLVGPPGTGKTLLARATAGEAGVPFFSISGSDFVEMFVGVGAARVRDMFKEAQAKAPCIIFIDEIDAIGQARATIGAIGGNDEREQTLNQLLAEMDGFAANQGVIVMGATNRPEVLDQALLRPGRFDRRIQVTLPTVEGRRQILKIHSKEVRLDDDADLERMAQITPGFSGADLANIVNEAALLAVRRDSDTVAMVDLELAIERVVAGLQRKMPLSDKVRRKVAYHEGGHALVAQLLPDTDPVHKVSIIPTAKGALGYTMQMPEEDQYLLGQRELEERLAVMLGGRSAEMLIVGEASTGAANDLERATELARRMVTEFGMTEALGPVRYAPQAGAGYLGRMAGVRPELSPETSAAVDRETRRLVEAAQSQAMDLLREHEGLLHQVAQTLLEQETISGDEIAQIVEGA
jgi:cell division protease FtsH